MTFLKHGFSELDDLTYCLNFSQETQTCLAGLHAAAGYSDLILFFFLTTSILERRRVQPH